MIRQSIYETNIKEEDIAFTLTNNKNEKHPNCIIFANDFGINELRKNKNYEKGRRKQQKTGKF